MTTITRVSPNNIIEIVTRGPQGISGVGAITNNLREGEIPYKLYGSDDLGSSGFRVSRERVVLAPIGFQVESGSIDYGDYLRTSELGGLFGIYNIAFNYRFAAVDYRVQRNEVGRRPRIFYPTEAEVEYVGQSDDSTVLTSVNPFIYTTQLQAYTNALKFNVNEAVTNFKAKIVQPTSNVVLKYIPNKAAHLEDLPDNGLNLPAGVQTIDLEDTPMTFTPDEQLRVEITFDSGSIKGSSSGLPWFAVMKQDAVWYEMPYLHELYALNKTTLKIDSFIQSRVKVNQDLNVETALRYTVTNAANIKSDNITLTLNGVTYSFPKPTEDGTYTVNITPTGIVTDSPRSFNYNLSCTLNDDTIINSPVRSVSVVVKGTARWIVTNDPLISLVASSEMTAVEVDVSGDSFRIAADANVTIPPGDYLFILMPTTHDAVHIDDLSIGGNRDVKGQFVRQTGVQTSDSIGGILYRMRNESDFSLSSRFEVRI